MKRESTYDDDDDIPFDMEGRSGSDDEDDHDESGWSSSFDGTTSSSGSSSTGSSSDDDDEVDSEFRDGFDGLFGKKRLTDDWRRFINPLKWRCKWVELRVKELYHQASKYDRELLEYDIEKNNSEQLMRRRKRKRIEDMIDVKTYMSNHNLFSLYENMKLKVDGLSVVHEFGERVKQSAYFVDDSEDNQDPPVLEFRKDDDSLEQILWRIDALQSHVLKLKIQLEKATCNSTEHPSMENSHLLDSKMGLSHVDHVGLDNPHTRDLSKDVRIGLGCITIRLGSCGSFIHQGKEVQSNKHTHLIYVSYSFSNVTSALSNSSNGLNILFFSQAMIGWTCFDWNYEFKHHMSLKACRFPS